MKSYRWYLNSLSEAYSGLCVGFGETKEEAIQCALSGVGSRNRDPLPLIDFEWVEEEIRRKEPEVFEGIVGFMERGSA